MTKFYPKPAYFEKKSSVLNHAFLFNREISTNGKFLIITLNAITSTSGNWTPVQSDIQARLGWGREKMRNAVDELIKFGFLRITQRRCDSDKDGCKKGTFSTNELEFDCNASYLKISEDIPVEMDGHPEEECPHIECEPSTGLPSTVKPSTVEPSTVNQPQPVLVRDNLICIEKQQQQAPREPQILAAAPQLEKEQGVVVVPHQDREEKIRILTHYELSDAAIEERLIFPLQRIKDAAMAIEQWKLAKEEKGEEVANMSGAFRRALDEGWKPNPPKKTKEEIEFEAKTEIQGLMENNMTWAEMILVKVQKHIKEGFNIIIRDTDLMLEYLLHGRKVYYPLAYTESNFKSQLAGFINEHFGVKI